jgi:hypothetical protein
MSDAQVDRAVRALERIALALAAIYADQMKEKKLPAKAKRLSQLGFSNVQIADALGSTPNSINVALHMARKKKTNRARSKRAGKVQ